MEGKNIISERNFITPQQTIGFDLYYSRLTFFLNSSNKEQPLITNTLAQWQSNTGFRKTKQVLFWYYTVFGLDETWLEETFTLSKGHWDSWVSHANLFFQDSVVICLRELGWELASCFWLNKEECLKVYFFLIPKAIYHL